MPKKGDRTVEKPIGTEPEAEFAEESVQPGTQGNADGTEGTEKKPEPKTKDN